MKNQYFGDIQDYRKYGLLRQLTGAGRLSLGVVWMLTPGDERTDGSRLAYLEQPQLYRPLDPQLFGVLRESLGQQGRRGVAQIERSAALPDAVFFSDLTPDASEARGQFMAAARRAVAGAELVFLDPDNGFEVASVARGRKNSSKYVYWDEVQRMYAQGHSVLTYQHFPRPTLPPRGPGRLYPAAAGAAGLGAAGGGGAGLRHRPRRLLPGRPGAAPAAGQGLPARAAGRLGRRLQLRAAGGS